MKAALSLLFLFLITLGYGQLKMDSVVSVESRCANNGSLTVNASGGSTPYTYSLISPSKVTRSGQSSNVFAALGPGSYTVQVEDNASTKVKATITVKGNFTQVAYKIKSEQSHCNKANGNAMFYSFSGGRKPFEFSIFSGPTKKSWQKSDTIKGLLPGNYIGSVKDSCGNVRNTSFVIKDKVTQAFSLTTSFEKIISCDSIAYKVYGSNGLAPYKFLVVSGSDTVFRKVGTGAYSVKLSVNKVYDFIAKDSCGTIKKVRINAANNPRKFRLYHSLYSHLRCDTLLYYVRGYYGLSPYRIAVVSGKDTMYNFHGSGINYFKIDRSKSYKVIGIDTCGKKDSFTIQPTIELKAIFKSSCGSKKVRLYPYLNKLYIKEDSCMIYGMQDVTTNITVWQSKDEFDFTPNVKYNFYAKDTCCNKTYTTTSFYNETLPKAYIYKGVYTSYDSTSGLRIIASYFSGPVSVVLLKTPYTNKDKFTPTSFHKDRAPLKYVLQVGDTIKGYSNFFFSNLPSGKYQFLVVDTCGSKDTVSMDILKSDLWRPKYQFTSITRCPSDHILYFARQSNFYGYGTGSIKKIAPNTSLLTSSVPFIKGSKIDTFLNQTAGTYVYEFKPTFYNSFIEKGLIYFRDTIVIKDPGYPVIDRAQTYGCSNNTSSIIVSASDGVKPYKYRIQKNGSSTWSNYQLSNEFHGIAPGLYKIEITDTCGNVTTASSSSGVFTAPKINLSYKCFDDSLILSCNKVNGVNYRWTKNDVFFSTSLTNEFKPYTKSDYGIYKLQVYLNTPKGVCVDTSVSIELEERIVVDLDPLYVCDSVYVFDNWVSESGVYMDTTLSSGGCDSVTRVKVSIGRKAYYLGDTAYCDSLYLFGNWYRNNTSIVDTFPGFGLIIDTLAGTGFEGSLTGWTLNNTAVSSGDAKSGQNKIIFNSTTDWIELPPVDFPEELTYSYKLSSDRGYYNRILIQYYNGSSWVNIEEHYHNTGVYESLKTDLNLFKDSTNVRLRIKARLFQNILVSSYLDDVYVRRKRVSCDTIINLKLNLFKASLVKDSIVFCDSGMVNDKWYYQSQTAKDTLLSSSNCDSIVHTTITVNNSEITHKSLTYCDSIILRGLWYYKSRIIKDTVSTIKNCDSIIITDLTINNTIRKEVNVGFCDSGVVRKNWYYATQIVFDTLSSMEGCDSITKFNILVNDTKRTNLTLTFCDSGRVRGKTYYSSQTRYDTLLSSSNCDSIISTFIVINKTKRWQQNIVLCDSGIVYNTMYTSSKIRKDTFLSYLGCDSIVITDIRVYPTKITNQIIADCDSSWVNGKWYYFSQIIYDTFLSYTSCDSLVITDLSISKTVIINHSLTFCDSGLVDGIVHYFSSILRDTLKTYANCDSILITDLVINRTKRINSSISVCDEWILNGNRYTQSEIIVDTLSSSLGCDSIVTSDLVVRYSNETVLRDTFCTYYDYVMEDGTIVSTGGLYRFNYRNMADCDSIVELDLYEKKCPKCTVFLPNAITINEDNLNDEFKLYGNCKFKVYSLKIFNRWGELIFESSDPSVAWNGSFNGKKVPQGVYVYQLDFINLEQKRGIYSGDFTVLW